MTAPSASVTRVGIIGCGVIAKVYADKFAKLSFIELSACADVQASRYRYLEIYGTEGTLAVPDPNTFGGPVQIKRHFRDEWHDVPLTHGNARQSRGIGLADMVRGIQRNRAHRASGDQLID